MYLHDAADTSLARLWWITTSETSRHSQALYLRGTKLGLTNVFHGIVLLVTGLFMSVFLPLAALASFLVFTPFACLRRSIEIKRFADENPEVVQQSREAAASEAKEQSPE